MPHCHGEIPEVPDPTDVPAGGAASAPHADGPDPTASPGTEPSPRTARDRGVDRRQFLLAFLAVTSVLVAASAVAYSRSTVPPPVQLAPGATIYYNEACSDCAIYLADDLLPTLAAAGASPVVVKDYINTPAYRQELRYLNDAMGIPFELQSHLVTFVRDARISVFEGHVPGTLMLEALAVPDRVERLLIHQDSMGGVTEYGAWAFAGEARHYPIDTPVTEYLVWFAANGGGSTGPAPAWIPLVVSTGFVDGLNPCAFAVLLFFISFLFVTRRPRSEVLWVGGLYIYAVFLAYLLIGLGLLGAIMISEDPHLLARISGVFVAVIGGFVLLQPYLPHVPNPFHMPKVTWDRVRAWMLHGTSPAAAISGFFVGLCTFPCSGGIYVAVLSLLAAKTTYAEGLGYLYLYNLAFILPLVLVLAVVSNKAVARRATAWERGHTSLVRAVAAVAMIAIGVLTLLLV